MNEVKGKQIGSAKEILEEFFRSKFDQAELSDVLEMRFENNGLHYRIWLMEKDQSVWFSFDTRSEGWLAFPSFEFGMYYSTMEAEPLSGGIPALFCHDRTGVLRLVVARTASAFSFVPSATGRLESFASESKHLA